MKAIAPASPKLSLKNAQWQEAEYLEREVLTLIQKKDLPELVARYLVSREIDVNSVDDYLDPKLKHLLPDPSCLLDMDKAVERITTAIEQKESIVIFGDYDVDGATSSALLIRFFRFLGVKATAYIPDRQKEGYGPNIQALTQLKAQGAQLCITVDCGTMSFEPLAEAAKIGLDVIVVDHHLGSEILPQALCCNQSESFGSP